MSPSRGEPGSILHRLCHTKLGLLVSVVILIVLLVTILPPAIILTQNSSTTAETTPAVAKRKGFHINLTGTGHQHKAGPAVDPSFVAFALEERSLLYYAGRAGEPNTFSQNLLDEVGRRTGVAPIIRIGGTSVDRSRYLPHSHKAVTYPPGQKSQYVPQNLTIGPKYFESFANLNNVRYVFTVPLAADHLNDTVAFTKAGYAAITTDAGLVSIGIGNEPDLYAGTVRPESYGPDGWASQFIQYSTAIDKALDLSNDQPIYDAEGLSTRVDHRRLDVWTQENIFKGGLDKVKHRIKSVSLHYYQTDALPSSNLQRDLMNHTAIVKRSELLFAPSLRFLQKKNIPLVAGEVGSALNLQSEKVSLFEGVLGAALWQVDFMLHCMSIGIYRVNMQQGIGFPFALWQPTEYWGLAPHVRAPYYAQLFAADFLGKSAATKAFRVAPVELKGNGDVVSAYIGFEDGTPVRLALINLEAWDPSMSRPRPTLTFRIQLPTPTRQAQIRKLTSPGGATAAAKDDLTWSGKAWTYSSLGKAMPIPGVEDVKDMKTDERGAVEVTVSASEAVMVSI